MLSFNQAQLARLAGLDLTKKRERKKRQINWIYEQQIKAANALHGLGVPVNAATVRLVLDELGILTEQGGNQSIGDTLGRLGLNLPTYREGGEKCYRVPEGGITKGLISVSFASSIGHRRRSAP